MLIDYKYLFKRSGEYAEFEGSDNGVWNKVNETSIKKNFHRGKNLVSMEKNLKLITWLVFHRLFD